MNMKNLINLINQLYPKDMLQYEAKLDNWDTKDMGRKTSETYLQKPEALKVFEDNFCLMSNPTLHLETVKSENKKWDTTLKFNQRLQKDVANPDTYLATKTYTPSYFNSMFNYINRNKQEIAKFAKTLTTSDEIYYTQQDDLSNETHRYILTRALVKRTVKHSIANYKKMVLA